MCDRQSESRGVGSAGRVTASICYSACHSASVLLVLHRVHVSRELRPRWACPAAAAWRQAWRWKNENQVHLRFQIVFVESSDLNTVSQKSSHLWLSVTLSNLNRFSKIFALHYDITYLTLCMLLYYLGTSKTWIFCRYTADMKESANKLHFIASNFVIYSQILTCSVFKIVSLSPWLQIKLSMTRQDFDKTHKYTQHTQLHAQRN